MESKGVVVVVDDDARILFNRWLVVRVVWLSGCGIWPTHATCLGFRTDLISICCSPVPLHPVWPRPAVARLLGLKRARTCARPCHQAVGRARADSVSAWCYVSAENGALSRVQAADSYAVNNRSGREQSKSAVLNSLTSPSSQRNL
jgi:hypothetical protein